MVVKDNLRVKLGTEGFKDFFPVLVGCEAATWREAYHMTGVELTTYLLVDVWFSDYLDLHIQWSERVAARRQRNANAVIERIWLVIRACVLRLV